MAKKENEANKSEKKKYNKPVQPLFFKYEEKGGLLVARCAQTRLMEAWTKIEKEGYTLITTTVSPLRHVILFAKKIKD
jgi:hypothetical protein